jgi:hypothetical protein
MKNTDMKNKNTLIKKIQLTMVSTLNFSQQEIDNVKYYSEELLNEIIKEIIECEM